MHGNVKLLQVFLCSSVSKFW